MLNLSENRIEGLIHRDQYKAFGLVRNYRTAKIFARILTMAFLIFLIVLFLPWTQNIQSVGFVTTLRPDQRPQTINSIIAGRIEKWFVREGDFVKKGDTIMFISEIKDDYFDPNLLANTKEQIRSKELSARSYMDKVRSLDQQIDALLNTKTLKIEQARNYVQQARLKIQSDSTDYQASIVNLNIAKQQLERMEQLYKEGLKSLTDLEARRMKMQEAQAKKISQENKLLTSRNELINAKVELQSLENQYMDKISKAESEKYASMSGIYETEAAVTKMQNQYMNYSVRSGYYYITAPQDGYITKTLHSGIGETIKDGEELLSIMPSNYSLAVFVYVKPLDLPLIRKGQHIRFMFDGWPAVVFSGWPNLSYGTYGGDVVAIDNFISENGMYRILVAPSSDDRKWPDGLRVGSGAKAMALLKDVPIWYELWRKFNGFPPDYYMDKTIKKPSAEKKNK